MKNGKILKIAWIISFIISIIVFIKKDSFITSSLGDVGIYEWSLIIIEIINIIFGVLFLLKNKKTKVYIITYLLFILITFFIPIYRVANYYAPTGPDSHLMGLAVENQYFNIYGINIGNN